LVAFVAEIQRELIRFAITMDVPASLRLGHYSQLRTSAWRLVVVGSVLGGSCWIAFAGLRSSREPSRVAVQPEVDNAEAIRLSEASGLHSRGGLPGAGVVARA
jgi:hypothetical protein